MKKQYLTKKLLQEQFYLIPFFLKQNVYFLQSLKFNF